MQVAKHIFKKSPYLGCGLMPCIDTYASLTGEVLVGTISEHVQRGKGQATYCKTTIIRSEDNGETWVEEDFGREEIKPDGSINLTLGPSFFLDGKTGLLLRFFLRTHISDGDYWGMGPGRTHRQFYQVSRDGGNRWGPEEQISQNNIFISNAGITLSGGDMLFPFSTVLPKEECGRGKWGRDQSAALIGKWKKDLAGIEWQAGDYLRISWEKSSVGLGEPALAQLRDGRVLAIMRASQNPETNSPPLKYYALSKDNGRHWSEPATFSFDDGTPLYSPQAISRLIRSSKNNRLYWIGNILPSPEVTTPSGHRPRHPLQIAEVDEERIGIKKTTIVIIDDQKENDVEREYSNFGVYEDRKTKNFVLTLCEMCADPLPTSDERWTSDAYRYDICLPG